MQGPTTVDVEEVALESVESAEEELTELRSEKPVETVDSLEKLFSAQKLCCRAVRARGQHHMEALEK